MADVHITDSGYHQVYSNSYLDWLTLMHRLYENRTRWDRRLDYPGTETPQLTVDKTLRIGNARLADIIQEEEDSNIPY